MNPSVVIVGAGAIGAWIGDALDRAGWSVSMVARGATLEALHTAGLRVARDGATRTSWPQAGTAAQIGARDYVVLAVKAQFLPALAPELAPLIGADTVVISATNGIPWWFLQDFDGPLAGRLLESVDPDGSQAQVFPKDRTLGSVIHASVRSSSPAHAEVVAADRLMLGRPNGASSPQLAAVVQALQAGGINARTSNDIRSDVWAKLWGNMTMNPLSALTRCGTARMLANPQVRELCICMMDEMQRCARRLGVPTAMTPAQRIEVTERLGDFKTSMLADLEAGRPLEIDPQLGAVVEIARLLQVPAPFMQSVLGLTRLISPTHPRESTRIIGHAV
ncbi:MAG TPA: 2-dehydropantoate 2-reductase [Steroidobacteraceae bacterium]|jgi:2-dehydropantoate 2-reductase|nr:2-dehydropantoate 2-reductase [Steroidobacteraceae bacterium]